MHVCVRGVGWGGGVAGSQLILLCRDLSAICQPALGLCTWSCLMNSRCFPWLLLSNRTSTSSQPTLANTQINTRAECLIKTPAYSQKVIPDSYYMLTCAARADSPCCPTLFLIPPGETPALVSIVSVTSLGRCTWLFEKPTFWEVRGKFAIVNHHVHQFEEY